MNDLQLDRYDLGELEECCKDIQREIEKRKMENPVVKLDVLKSSAKNLIGIHYIFKNISNSKKIYCKDPNKRWACTLILRFLDGNKTIVEIYVSAAATKKDSKYLSSLKAIENSEYIK